MARLPMIRPIDDTAMDVRCVIPIEIWRVASKLGLDLDAKAKTPAFVGLRFIFRELAGAFRRGEARWTPSQAIGEAIEAVSWENSQRPCPKIDISKLHRNPKLKSGFVGVYANGRADGFRAEARSGVNTRPIGIFRFAEEAAQARRDFYIANKIPYGEIETELDKMRRDNNFPQFRTMTDRQLVAETRRHLNDTGLTVTIFGPSCVTWVPPEFDDPEVFDRTGPSAHDALLAARARIAAAATPPEQSEQSAILLAAQARIEKNKRAVEAREAANVAAEAETRARNAILDEEAQARKAEREARKLALTPARKAASVAPLFAGAATDEPRPLGFENLPLPDAFNDDWKPEESVPSADEESAELLNSSKPD